MRNAPIIRFSMVKAFTDFSFILLTLLVIVSKAEDEQSNYYLGLLTFSLVLFRKFCCLRYPIDNRSWHAELLLRARLLVSVTPLIFDKLYTRTFRSCCHAFFMGKLLTSQKRF